MSFSATARRLALRGRGRLCRTPDTPSLLRGVVGVLPSASATTPVLPQHHIVVHRPTLSSRQCRLSTSAAAPAAPEGTDDGDDDDDLPPFASIDGLHPSSLHAVTQKMNLTRMTEIQHKVFAAAASGQDVLGRARTGTGKTLAFLLPAIENSLRVGRVPGPHGYQDKTGGKGGIATLIVSPTRELAIQIHSQAQVLASSHANSAVNDEAGGRHGRGYRMRSQVMYGGSSRNVDLQKLADNPPFILVATPGRLIDHMQNSYVRGIPFQEIIGNVSVWVLDEADRCLDMGFRKDMEWILDVRKRFQDLARRDGKEAAFETERQTLLFSATLPKDLRSIMASHMRKDYLTVDCVHDVDPTTHTNASIDQSFVTLPDASQNRWIAGLVDVLEDIIHVQQPDDYKAVVFFPTTQMCAFFSHVFTHEFRTPVLEIHSRKSQTNRTFTSDKFRKWEKGILFTTDVSARGVDYPNVTHVIQYGSADSRETYIHRLGRTGRAGKKGKGILIANGMGEEHQFVKNKLRGLNVRKDGRMQRIIDGDVVAKDGDGGGGLNGALRRKEINEKRLEKILDAVGTGSNSKLQKMASDTYRSLMGYSVTKVENLGMNHKGEVVDYLNSLATQMGFDMNRLPRMSPKIVQTLGLQGIRGINVGTDNRGNRDGGGRRQRGNDDRGGGRGYGGQRGGPRDRRQGNDDWSSRGRGGQRGGNRRQSDSQSFQRWENY